MYDGFRWFIDLKISSISFFEIFDMDRYIVTFLQKCIKGRVAVIVEYY